MILSKIKRNITRFNDLPSSSFILFNYTIRQIQQSNIQIYNLNNSNKKNLCLTIVSSKPYHLNFYRYFKTRNHFAKTKENSLGDAIEKIIICILTLIGISMLVNLKVVWNNLPNFITAPITAFVTNFSKICVYIHKFFKKADSLAANSSSNIEEFENNANSIVKSVSRLTTTNQDDKSASFRDKRIIEYENRIRLYSNPDKIFRYFASIKITYKNGDSEIYMTPDDFLRALTPGIKQPDGLGLDQFKKIDLEKDEKHHFKFNLQPDSIFYKLSKYGLINFSDFLFLLTLLSVSKRHFEIAFRMFDLNGDGDVEYYEFEKVQNAILSQTSIGKKMGSSVHYKGISSAVSRYFFAPDLKSRLTTQKFVEFQQALQYELLTLEFDRKKSIVDADKISEIDFAELLVAYANLPEKKRQKMIRRVEQKFFTENSQGISKEDYLEFFRFLRNINDVDVALTVYNIAGASIDQGTLKHVAKTVANVHLSDHVVDVVFTLFDDNDDGHLSNKEFVAVMKERLRRGLLKPKDTGFFKILYVMWRSLINFEL